MSEKQRLSYKEEQYAVYSVLCYCTIVTLLKSYRLNHFIRACHLKRNTYYIQT